MRKKVQIKLKTLELNWLIRSHSKLSLDNKATIYKGIIKPTWTCGIQLYGYTSSSNIELILRSQSEMLRTMTRAPWYEKKYRLKLEMHLA